MRPTQFASLILLATLFTLLNALKPLHIDDTAYYYYAKHIAQRPLDPYGFTVHWYDFPQSAQRVLAPPVLPYWWAAGICLFGEQPFLWKMWLLPFSLLLVFSLHRILRRFARGVETPLLWMTILSPAMLPSFNLMLDVPALALSVGALSVFITACDRGSWRQVILAGLLAGLAMETKYTAFLAPPVLLLYAVVYRRLRYGMLAAGLAVGFFVSCEGLLAWRYGASHFLTHLHQHPGNSLERPLNLARALVGLLGGTASALGLLGLTALGYRGRTVLGVGALLAVGFGLVLAIPEPHNVLFRDAITGKGWAVNSMVVGPLGLLVMGTLAAAAWRLSWSMQLGSPARRSSADLFVVLWLLLELAGYFALTPFPASRRILGVLVAGGVVLGRVASRTRFQPARLAMVQGVATLGILLGLLFFYADFRDARAEKDAVEAASRWVRCRQADAVIWYAGHWGFQFYAERAGLQPLLPTDQRPQPGEWVILPDRRVTQQPWPAGQDRTETITTLAWQDSLPLRTVPCFHAGSTPLEHHDGPRIAVTICRVK